MMFTVLGISCSTRSLTSDTLQSFPCSVCGAERLCYSDCLHNTDVYTERKQVCKSATISWVPKNFSPLWETGPCGERLNSGWSQFSVWKKKDCTMIQFDAVTVTQNTSWISCHGNRTVPPRSSVMVGWLHFQGTVTGDLGRNFCNKSAVWLSCSWKTEWMRHIFRTSAPGPHCLLICWQFCMHFLVRPWIRAWPPSCLSPPEAIFILHLYTHKLVTLLSLQNGFKEPADSC